MRKRLDGILNILMGAALGVYLGYALYTYVDYGRHPQQYATWSAPWYTGLLLRGAWVLGFLAVCAAAKFAVRKLSK